MAPKKNQEGSTPRRLTTAASVVPEAVKFVWEDRIPKGGLTVVAGRPDQGKGLFTAKVAADVTRTGRNVIYSAAEDGQAFMTRPRLEAAGADLDRVFLPDDLELPGDLEVLHRMVVDNDVALVVLDPFNAHLKGASRFSDSIRPVTTGMKKIAESTGCAFLIVEHIRKKVSKNEHPLNAIGGNSSGLPAACRMGFLFGIDPDDDERRILANVKHNVREKAKAMAFEIVVAEYEVVGTVAALDLEGEVEFNDIDLVATDNKGGKTGPKPDKRAAATEWLTNYLVDAGQPVRSAQIKDDAVIAGMTEKTLRRAADDMEIVRSAKGGPNVTWDLPQEVKDAMGGGQ